MITKTRVALLLFFSLLLSGCEKVVMLDPKGIVALAQKHLLFDAVFLMLLIVIPVIILSFLIVTRFRAGNLRANYAPEWSHSTLLESIWWAVPCVIIAILATITWITCHTLDPHRPLKSDAQPINVQVVALDWKWLFIYPDEGVASVNFLQIPVNVPVKFRITADAPMNSFQIPQLGGQIYAMPGMDTELNLMASAPGDYRGMSANFSGNGFSGMSFIARAGSEEEFKAWVQKAKQSNTPLTISTYKTLAKPSENNKPQAFSKVASNLFRKIIMKYMEPNYEDLGEPSDPSKSTTIVTTE